MYEPFLQDHRQRNHLIINEQTQWKKEVWGCVEQLLINRTLLKGVPENCSFLITTWLEYQKAFDNVPHKCLIKTLELAKVPEKLTTRSKNLMKKWSKNVNIHSGETSVESKLMQYLSQIS